MRHRLEHSNKSAWIELAARVQSRRGMRIKIYRIPTYGQLTHQAWILAPATRRRPAGGSVRPADLPAVERYRFMREIDEE